MTREQSSVFRGLAKTVRGSDLIVVDLGYSSTRKSCGVAWSGGEAAVQVQFGQAVSLVGEKLQVLKSPVIVLEAVLSTYHDVNGNPDLRGEFERGRGWYYGPGVLTLVAARRFLEQLQLRLPANRKIDIAEAFLTNKRERSCHSDDAKAILANFWRSDPVELRTGVEPLLGSVSGLPPVRDFCAKR